MKCYKIKVGDRWASHSGLTLDPSKARMFSKISYAKSSIRHNPYLYYEGKTEIVEFEVTDDKEGWVSVQLPSKDSALSDYLEEIGYTEAANKLRGLWAEK